ncbi:hypothetical protein LSH36_827g00034 [Paralvinella palmiformis]|uniref:Uncharacterized protein n=1 Tax=Paralvinella palmiformis TaxID=53620 RepID=A0AAD9J0X1_9ANNE|nr:hypothetical protein LSH36_827g00034 [Paralvinella palmiformis]
MLLGVTLDQVSQETKKQIRPVFPSKTSSEKLPLSNKQRHHLQDVQKTLNISLDFSSEDEEEIKALKDQIPEQLTTADSVPGNHH